MTLQEASRHHCLLAGNYDEDPGGANGVATTDTVARLNVTPHQRQCIVSAFYQHQHKIEAIAKGPKSRNKADKQIKKEARRCMVEDLHALCPDLVLLIPDYKRLGNIFKSTQLKFINIVQGSEGSGQGRESERGHRWFELMDRHQRQSAATQQPALQNISDRTGKRRPHCLCR